MTKKAHYPDNIGINDCIHAKACRRLRKKIESESGQKVTLGCFKESCTAYAEKAHEDDIDRLTEILTAANNCPMMLPSESRERAADLYSKAIEIIERITGKEWNFETWTF